MAAEASSPVREGDLVAEKYRVERVLGAGGMGVVVAATHVHLGQRVAVKFLLQEACSDEVAVTRFLREARAAARIRSEHVARVSDVGTMPNGAPYMVMEHLAGADLAQVVSRGGGGISIEHAIDYVLQACEAIAEAHALGIIHRDLKPSNLFLAQRADGSPLVKVLDFGISKMRERELDGREAASVTAPSSMMGSPLYMSPEQIRSAKNVDARTDIWSLGVILCELLTGRPPFEAETLAGLCATIAGDPAPSLRARRAEIPEGLAAVVLGCLEKDVARRWPSVAELAVALAPFGSKRARLSAEHIVGVVRASGLPAPSPPGSVPPPHGPAGRMDATGSTFGTTVGRARAMRRWGVIAIAGIVAAIGIGLLGRGTRLFTAEQPTAKRTTTAPPGSQAEVVARSETGATARGEASAAAAQATPSGSSSAATATPAVEARPVDHEAVVRRGSSPAPRARPAPSAGAKGGERVDPLAEP